MQVALQYFPWPLIFIYNYHPQTYQNMIIKRPLLELLEFIFWLWAGFELKVISWVRLQISQEYTPRPGTTIWKPYKYNSVRESKERHVAQKTNRLATVAIMPSKYILVSIRINIYWVDINLISFAYALCCWK